MWVSFQSLLSGWSRIEYNKSQPEEIFKSMREKKNSMNQILRFWNISLFSLEPIHWANEKKLGFVEFCFFLFFLEFLRICYLRFREEREIFVVYFIRTKKTLRKGKQFCKPNETNRINLIQIKCFGKKMRKKKVKLIRFNLVIEKRSKSVKFIAYY